MMKSRKTCQLRYSITARIRKKNTWLWRGRGMRARRAGWTTPRPTRRGVLRLGGGAWLLPLGVRLADGHEVAEHGDPVPGVLNFRVERHAEQRPPLVAHDLDGRGL